MDPSLLYFTLFLALISFLCSTYTILRTLLPLLPGHPLNRRRTPSSRDSDSPEKPPRLKSAQRFTVYLAVTDVFATCVLLWEVAWAASSNSQLGSNKLSDSRVYLATTARPTLLLIVAVLSYANVIRGKSISLGFADCIVWGPALVFYAVGGGLASTGKVGGLDVWIGLIVWLATVTLIVSVCFTRLLVAILRVRSITRKEQIYSPWAREQEKVLRSVSEYDLPYHQRYSLTFHSNFSGLSTNFLSRIGRSSKDYSQGTAKQDLANRSVAGGFTPRQSQDIFRECEYGGDSRSPTPGSTRGLLDRSTATTPAPNFSHSTSKPQNLDDGPAEVLHNSPRQSIGESIASRASTYLAAGGFVGNSSVRQAIIKEAWKDQDPPGTGHAPKVELSEKEARGAIVRLGGHLASSILGFALVSPLVCLRIAGPTAEAPLLVSFLLVVGVCQPSLVLSYQCWKSEGFWFRRPPSPIPTSSSTFDFVGLEIVSQGEVKGRTARRTSNWRDSLPGIRTDGEDCVSVSRSRLGRALSILSTHPKLQLLNSPSDDPAPSPALASASGSVKAATTTGHARLRSLKLSKGTVMSMGDILPRARAGSSASRKTFGGFEHNRNTSTPVNEFDKAIALELLASRPKTPKSAHTAVSSRAVTPTPSPTPMTFPAPLPDSHASDFDFSVRELSLSRYSSTIYTTSEPRESSRPISIDYLSAHVLPQLVPSVRLSRNVHVETSSAPLPTPPRPFNSIPTRRRNKVRATRSLSLPLVNVPALPVSSEGAKTDSEVWIAVENTIQVEHGQEKIETGEEEPIPHIDPTIRTLPSFHNRSGSSATRLDISFDWEAVDGTETLELDEATFADESSAGEDEPGTLHRRRSRDLLSPTLPYSPVLPLSFTRRPSPRPELSKPQEDPVANKGSKSSVGDDDDEDVHTSTFHCATVRPVLRSPEQTGSIGSTRTFNELNQSSITSEGFRNLLSSAGCSWHAPASRGGFESASSDDQHLRYQGSFPRRPLPTPPVQVGNRPASLLGQRDLNSSTSASESELQKTHHYRAARKAEGTPAGRPNVSLPPIPVPATIEEVEEDRKSGTPTPRRRRSFGRSRQEREAPDESSSRRTPATIGSTSRTPPNVTSRTKLRSRHQRNASSLSLNDENVFLPVSPTVESTSRTPRSKINFTTRAMR
ncbi:hypothetical protein JCM16303_001890 [Sporobolomyces ruberrimus]